MAQIGLGMDEARARYDEAVEIVDKALAEPIISHHGKFWHFDNLRLTPRTIQQPHPPKWVTVISVSSARKAARRGAKISTAFHPQSKVIEIFDAYRDEAHKAGRKVGPDDLCIRRQVVMLDDANEVAKRRRAFRDFIKLDPRVDLPDRPAALDSPSAHSFSIGEEEFIVGSPDAVAEQIIAQCRSAGAGHFAALFDRMASPAQFADYYREFGAVTIPLLRSATL
jgi:alkanesulfonate monooxygenase SsuD/methylene tetrahydromethanopterin reductase-like flavin-dependent oxidoreductase (luciferase family)